MTTEKTIPLAKWTFVGKMMCMLFNMLSKQQQQQICHSFSSKEQASFKFMLQSLPTVILEPPPKKKICNCIHCFPIYLPWSDGTRCHDLSFFKCWVLSQLFFSPLSSSSRSSLVPLHFLSLECYHLHISSCGYFSWQSWFQLVSLPAQHVAWYSLHISSISRMTISSLKILLSEFWTSP